MPARSDDREAKRERLLKAAVGWVYDQTCSSALMELEEAAEAFLGVPVHEPKEERR